MIYAVNQSATAEPNSFELPLTNTYKYVQYITPSLPTYPGIEHPDGEGKFLYHKILQI